MEYITVLNGPNLNRLGKREASFYGYSTLDDVRVVCNDFLCEHGMGLHFLQSASEGALVDYIGDADENSRGIVINAGAYTHTSIAILDALLSVSIPAIEVHISNIHARDEFRRHSMISKGTRGMVAGFGIIGYRYALQALIDIIKVM